MTKDVKELNEILNNVFIELVRTLYLAVGPNDISQKLEVTLKFDDLQRISQYQNLLLDNKPKTPPQELTEKINNITTKITKLPKEYQLEIMYIEVNPGGNMKVIPGYKAKANANKEA